MATTKARRAALYLRVSTDGQTTENQRLALEAIARQRGWAVVRVFSDNGVSGAKGPTQRPELAALLSGASRGEFDVVMAWAMDRLGRSLTDLLDIVAKLEHCRVDLFLHQQEIDTTSPSGKLFFHMTAAFAEYERGIIKTRVMAGLDRARAQGKQLGRPKIGADIERAIRAELANKVGIGKTARTVGAGVSTVQRIARSMRAEQAPAPETGVKV
jgi:DNA invertase Pin-like site-specific DNA recombinase